MPRFTVSRPRRGLFLDPRPRAATSYCALRFSHTVSSVVCLLTDTDCNFTRGLPRFHPQTVCKVGNIPFTLWMHFLLRRGSVRTGVGVCNCYYDCRIFTLVPTLEICQYKTPQSIKRFLPFFTPLLCWGWG